MLGHAAPPGTGVRVHWAVGRGTALGRPPVGAARPRAEEGRMATAPIGQGVGWTRARVLRASAGGLAAAVLAACAAGGSGAPAPEAGPPVSIGYWFTNSPPWTQIRTDLIAKFN